jgi:hypothetical protein
MEHLGEHGRRWRGSRAEPRIWQALPLLPLVLRGRDGLLRIGGTRPHESALWIDGFDVTDPVTLTSAIDLPNESVKGMAVVRDPVSATFSGVLGSMASIETTAGTGAFHGGIQGFIPRPRLNAQYGLGRIEAFFPRARWEAGPTPAIFIDRAELNGSASASPHSRGRPPSAHRHCLVHAAAMPLLTPIARSRASCRRTVHRLFRCAS